MKALYLLLSVLIWYLSWKTAHCSSDVENLKNDLYENKIKNTIGDLEEKAGVNFAVNQWFLDCFTRGILPKIWDLINQQIVVKGKTISLKVSDLFTIYFNILELRLSDVYYDSTLTNVTLFEKNNSIGFHITVKPFTYSLFILFFKYILIRRSSI